MLNNETVWFGIAKLCIMWLSRLGKKIILISKIARSDLSSNVPNA